MIRQTVIMATAEINLFYQQLCLLKNMFLWKSKVIRRSQSLWLEALLLHSLCGPKPPAISRTLLCTSSQTLCPFSPRYKDHMCTHLHTHTRSMCHYGSLQTLALQAQQIFLACREINVFVHLSARIHVDGKKAWNDIHKNLNAKDDFSVINQMCVYVFSLLYLDDLHVQ